MERPVVSRVCAGLCEQDAGSARTICVTIRWRECLGANVPQAQQTRRITPIHRY
jgi:hypothetical protein